MWRRLAILCAGLLLSGTAQAKLQLFTCEPEWAALARALGGEHIDVFSATSAHQDVHHIQARPSLIAKLRKADLLVCSGAGLEAGWLPVLLRRANNPRVLPGQAGHLDMSRHVDLLEDQEARILRKLLDVALAALEQQGVSAVQAEIAEPVTDH
ncbi:MAG: zinc ABC transporter substrate-binding protein, partial [Thiohalobacterales bacterium]|nr:zinc ABC transporter substrate-binding protein [Thiohalobacterales bacterium]